MYDRGVIGDGFSGTPFQDGGIIVNEASAGAVTVDWTVAAYQEIDSDSGGAPVGGGEAPALPGFTVTFVNPPGPAILRLILFKSFAGSLSVSWPTSVVWPDTETTWTVNANEAHLIEIFFTDLTNPFDYIARGTAAYTATS
jgi:hypothetical protein